MAVKLETPTKTLILNLSFRVRGLPLDREVPSLTVDGRDGEYVHEKQIRLMPRTVAVSGTVFGNTEEQAQEQLDELQAILKTHKTVKLYRDKNSSRFINVRFENIAHDFEEGTNRVVARVTITFKAHDPYWYKDGLTEIAEIVPFTPPLTSLEVVNEGNEYVEPIVLIRGPITNPKIINYTMSRTLRYNGTIAEDSVVIINPAKRTAIQLGDNIDHSGIARTGGEGSIQLADTASDVDGTYMDQAIRIVGGTGSGQSRKIIGYNGGTQVAIVGEEWAVIPDSTSEYEIYNATLLTGLFLHEAMTGSVVGGVNVIQNVSTEFLVRPFQLEAGTNRLELEGEGSDQFDVAFLYQARWL